MFEILALLQCLQPHIKATTVRQLNQIVDAMLAMTGRITMLGISRWTVEGGSYRTVCRFFAQVLPWPTLLWALFRQHLWSKDEVYLLAGDEVVVTKAGKKTYGVERFFSSLYGQSVPGLAFFTLSLVSVQQRRSFPIRIEQVIKNETEKSASAKKVQKSPDKSSESKKVKGGRPKGSKNKNKADVTLSSELTRIKGMVDELLKLICGILPLQYLVLDGHFGNNNALCMARQNKLHIISKLRSDSALYFPYSGPYSGRGQRRKYGDKLDYRNIEQRYKVLSNLEGNIHSCVYQMQLLHPEFCQPLNVVILVRTNLKTQERLHVTLFSSDLSLSHEQLVDYYSLRFQIEFNFRDAKQFWGLEDFMNITQNSVTNAANLSFFMVNLSHCLLARFPHGNLNGSIMDLKAYYRGCLYAKETLKLLPQKPEPVLLAQIFHAISCLGRIHAPSAFVQPS